MITAIIITTITVNHEPSRSITIIIVVITIIILIVTIIIIIKIITMITITLNDVASSAHPTDHYISCNINCQNDEQRRNGKCRAPPPLI
jgi:hypothetical protein